MPKISEAFPLKSEHEKRMKMAYWLGQATVLVPTAAVIIAVCCWILVLR